MRPAGCRGRSCARLGIEAVAGLVISRDIFGTNGFPDAHFCTCAEIRYEVIGNTSNFDDHIAVSFRLVEIRDGTYPLVGRESVRMVMQPVSDGQVSARWHSVELGSTGADLLAEAADGLSCVCAPLALGEIAGPEREDDNPPSFLLLKDPGAGWQIWRRFVRTVGGDEIRHRWRVPGRVVQHGVSAGQRRNELAIQGI